MGWGGVAELALKDQRGWMTWHSLLTTDTRLGLDIRQDHTQHCSNRTVENS